MKRLLISTSIFATAYAMAATFDIADYATTSTLSWSDESTWSITGESTGAYPTELDDVTFSNGGETDTNATKITVSGNNTVRSLNFDLYGSAEHFHFTIAKDASLTVKEDSVINSHRKSWNQTQFIGGGNSTLTFEKSLTIKNEIAPSDKTIVSLGSSGSGALTNLNIYGNLNIDRTSTKSSLEVYFCASNINIGGIANVGNGASLNLVRRTSALTSNISFGAIAGTSTLALGYKGSPSADLDGDPNTGKDGKEGTVYKYYNFKAYLTLGSNDITDASSWSGKLDKSAAGTTNAGSLIDITKIGSNEQAFRIVSLIKNTGVISSADDTSAYTDAEQYAINNLKVTAGTFVYGAGEGVLSGVLRNIAGTFKVGGVAAAEEGVMDVGTVNFASGEWVGGTIALDVDMSIGINDALNFNGTFNAASAKSDETASSRVLYIDFNSELMAELIESEGSYIAENLISYDSTNLTADDFVIKGVEGYDYEAVIGENGLGVIITAAVPEPADIAILIGAVALGFVAYRRRK